MTFVRSGNIVMGECPGHPGVPAIIVNRTFNPGHESYRFGARTSRFKY